MNDAMDYLDAVKREFRDQPEIYDEFLAIMGRFKTKQMLPPDVTAAAPAALQATGAEELMGMPLREAREEFERQYLESQVLRFGGNITKTAAFVGMERSALHRKLRALNIHSGRGGRMDGEMPAVAGADSMQPLLGVR